MAQASPKLQQEANIPDYVALLKPRVMLLVIFTAFCGYMVSPLHVHPFLAFVGILSIAIGAGASGCLNQWYEVHTDSLMKRTQNRPLVRGVIHTNDALGFGIILSLLSIILIQVSFGILQSFLLSFTIAYYAFFYTIYLKPRFSQNIVWGGAAGALPPVIGYSLGSPIDAYACSLFLIIFLWTPPHFWALAMTLKNDYEKAKTPMLPNIKGDIYTKKQIVYYAILTTLSSLLPIVLRPSHIFLTIIIIIVNIIWLHHAYKLYNETNYNPLKFFGISIFYLFVIFLLLSVFH